MSPTESTPYGTPVLVTLRGRDPVKGQFVRYMPDGRIGVSTHGGYGYYDADRVELVDEPRQPRRR